METGASAIVGRGVVEILPDFSKWGKQLASDMKIAAKQITGSMAPIEGSFRDANGRLRDANGAFLKDYQNGWKGATKTVLNSMASVGKGATALGIGLAAVSVKMAADFQAKTAVLQTAAGETAKGLTVVRNGIKDLAVNTGTGISNLTDGMYTIEKAGYRGADGLKVLTAAAEGAREENANLADVTNAMTSIMASYHLKADDSVKVMNALKTAAGEGKITMEQFAGSLSTVLPIASANHISLDQVAGSVATLTQHGTSANEATQELAATIRMLASPNAVASREMAKFGISAVDVSTKLGSRGLSGTFTMLVNTILSQMGPAGTKLQKVFEGTQQSANDATMMLQHMPAAIKGLAEQYLDGNVSVKDFTKSMKEVDVQNKPMLANFKTLVDRSRGFSKELKSGGPDVQTFTDALKKMSGGAIGLNTILQLTGESAAGNADRIAKVGKSFNDSGKDVEGWKITSQLLSVQLDKIKQQFIVMAINIGTKLIPVVMAATSWFTHHRGVLMGLVVTLGVFLATMSAVYIGMKIYTTYTRLAAVATGAYNLVMAICTKTALGTRIQLALLAVQEKAVAAATWVMEAAQIAWDAAMDASVIGLIVIAVAALIAGIVYLATKTQFFQILWKDVWGTIVAVVSSVVKWLKDNWQLALFTILTGGIGLAIAEIVRHWGAVKGAFVDAFDWVKSHWPLLLAIITGPIGWATYAIIKYWKQISGGVADAYHAVINWFARMGTDILSFFEALPGEIAGFFEALPGEIGGFFADIGDTIASWAVSAWKAVSGFFEALPGEIEAAAKDAKNWLLDTGSSLIEGLWKGATDFFTKSVPGFFAMLWHGIVDYFKAVFGIHSPSTVFADLGSLLIQGLLNGMYLILVTIPKWLWDNLYMPVITFFADALTWLYKLGIKVVTGLLNGWLYVANTIGSWLNTHIFQPVIGFFVHAGTWLFDAGKAVIQGQINGWEAIASGISGWFTTNIKNPVVNFFGKAVSWLYNAGKSVVNGLYTGFTDQWKTAISWIKGLKDKVVSAITSAFGISSPAKTMIPLGVHIIGGLMKGMLSSGPVLRSAVKSIFHSVTDVIQHGGQLAASFLGGIGGDIAGGVKDLGSLLPTGGSLNVNQLLGQSYVKAAYGWTGNNWEALKALWNGESGWNASALNASSGAYGIPQSLPADKMASAGSDWRTNPLTQIKWGAEYIASRYGNPANAYAQWLSRSPHWYDSGGIAKGVGMMLKNTNQPERVLSPRQTAAFENLVGAITGPRTAAPSGGLTVQRLVIENHGVIGSQREAEDWLVSSLTQLKRKNRLP